MCQHADAGFLAYRGLVEQNDKVLVNLHNSYHSPPLWDWQRMIKRAKPSSPPVDHRYLLFTHISARPR